MDLGEVRDRARAELAAGMDLTKCQQCGCMRETLETVQDSTSAADPQTLELADQAATWLARMVPIRYACLGCDHCYPAEALNALVEAGLVDAARPACAFESTDRSWPVVAGEYVAGCSGADCPVAVSTLASTELAEELARRQPAGLCIVGKTETENIGIDKVVKNVVANPTIRYLIVAGRDPAGHRSGQTLLALADNGVDEQMRIIGSVGKRPILRNVTQDEVRAFRQQVGVIDRIGCEDADQVIVSIEQLAAASSSRTTAVCECSGTCTAPASPSVGVPETIVAQLSGRVEMDRAGYFVIIPDPKRRIVVVEHYAYDNQLQHVIEGTASRDIYHTIIDAGWVSQLSHAAYLGKELTTAELSFRYGFPYIQDAG
jgi:tetrahydromethanopterin S-methyltransferase subunit A